MKVCSFLLLGVFVFWSCGNQNTNTMDESEENEEVLSNERNRPTKIVFFGNSLTAAYGLNPKDGFTAIVERKLEKKDSSYRIINAGISGETAADGDERVEWVLQQRIDFFVLELGLNDVFQGRSMEMIYQSLSSIIQKVKAAAPETQILLAEMELPAELGEQTNANFKAIYQRLAKDHKVALIGGFLEGVLDVPELNLPDGLHPNADGQKIIAETVWKTLAPLL